MIEAFIGALLGAIIGVIGGAYLIVKSAKDAVRITETKIIDGHKVIFVYEN